MAFILLYLVHFRKYHDSSTIFKIFPLAKMLRCHFFPPIFSILLWSTVSAADEVSVHVQCISYSASRRVTDKAFTSSPNQNVAPLALAVRIRLLACAVSFNLRASFNL